jgi:hypothetical protein
MPAPTRLALAGLVATLFMGLANPCPAIKTSPADTLSTLAPQAVLCIKPWAIPDRWDDETPVPGHPEWRQNGAYDHEPYTDQNRNGHYDLGEPYEDQNGDGFQNREYYDPFYTGYTAASAHGKLLYLNLSRGTGLNGTPAYAITPAALGRGAPSRAEAYRCAINSASCGLCWGGIEILMGVMKGLTKQAVGELLAQDPRAEWDEGCECIVRSDFEISPRFGLIMIYDPRVSHRGHRRLPPITKIGGLFVEAVDAFGNVSIRLMRIPTPSSQTEWTLPETGMAHQQDPLLRRSTWGQVKAVWR